MNLGNIRWSRVLLVLVIVVVLVIAGIVLIGGLGQKDDSNLPINLDTYCVKQGDYRTETGLVAIASDTNNIFGVVSPLGTKSTYFILLNDPREVIGNSFKEVKNSQASVVQMLKEKNVSALIIADPDKNLVAELAKNKIACYNILGKVNELLGVEPEPFPPKYCSELDASLVDFNEMDKLVGIALDKNDVGAVVSPLNAKAKLFWITSGTLVDTKKIANSFLSSSNANLEVVNMLSSLGVKTVFIASPSDSFSTELANANIACYNVTGKVSTFLK